MRVLAWEPEGDQRSISVAHAQHPPGVTQGPRFTAPFGQRLPWSTDTRNVTRAHPGFVSRRPPVIRAHACLQAAPTSPTRQWRHGRSGCSAPTPGSPQCQTGGCRTVGTGILPHVAASCSPPSSSHPHQHLSNPAAVSTHTPAHPPTCRHARSSFAWRVVKPASRPKPALTRAQIVRALGRAWAPRTHICLPGSRSPNVPQCLLLRRGGPPFAP